MQLSRPLALFLGSLLTLPAAGCRYFDEAPADAEPVAEPEVDPGDPEDPEDPSDELPAAAYEAPVFSDFALLRIDLGGGLVEEHDALSHQRDLSDYSNFVAGAVTAAAGIAIGAAVTGPPSLVLEDTVVNGSVSNPSTFVWEFAETTVIDGTTYDAVARYEARWYGWEVAMVVSASGLEVEFTDVVWFDGEMSYNGVVGTWQLYDLDGAETASVDYLQNDQGEFVAVIASDAGYLTATVFGSSRLITGTNASGESAAVGWDADSYEGFVSHPDYLNGAAACWDGALMNSGC